MLVAHADCALLTSMLRSVEPTVAIGADRTSSSREEAVSTNDLGLVDQEIEAGPDRECMTINCE